MPSPAGSKGITGLLIEFLADYGLQVIEILLVAVFFYYILLSAQSRKGTIVISIIIALGMLYFACQYLQLVTLKFLLEKIFLIGPLALLVIFTPEIRKGIENAATTNRLVKWLFGSGLQLTEEATSIVEVLDQTTEILKEKGDGALFVIERAEKVDSHLVPGTELQALMKPEFMASLFHRENPVHDGALLIRDGRVWSAANFLPMTDNKKIEADLGSRHRAAVGLSERCDAVVVVVSEERHDLSIAFLGRIARSLTQKQFIEQLRALLEPNENFATIVAR
jgi:diadenylate cyclase